MKHDHHFAMGHQGGQKREGADRWTYSGPARADQGTWHSIRLAEQSMSVCRWNILKRHTRVHVWLGVRQKQL